MLGVTAVADQPKAMHHYAREHGAGMNMNVPTRPLQRNDVERWAKLLNASEAQLQFMVAEYARFVDRYNAFMDEAAPQYLELGRELTELYREEGISSPAYAQLGRDVDQASIRLRDQLISLENSYIDRFEPILTPQQAQHVPLLRHDARRRNCRTFRSFM